MQAVFDLTQLLRADDIHLGFQSSSVIDAIPVLLRPALERGVRDRGTIEQIVDAAVKREAETSTRCGSLSLPHARSSSVSTFILALGCNPGGVIAGEAEPRLMFAFVSPESQRDQHLQLLATLARLSQNARVVSAIAGARSAAEVLQLLGPATPA